MNRLKGINNIADFKELLLLHKESIKKAALPVTVVAALLFFWISDSSEQKDIEEVDNPPQVIASQDVSENYETDIYVDISGCVYNPGVYMVESGTRLFEVIDKAGGLTDEADIDTINRAEEVYDGQKIIIKPIMDGGDTSVSSANTGLDSSGRININTADSVLLQEIPGIGPSTAQKIIDHRELNGKFKSIEDIKNVSGIGDKTFEKLKDYITV